jgi:SAM-dependent methyltransferase
VHWRGFRRRLPVDPGGGSGRGTPIDRYYVAQFVTACAADVRGRVLVFRDAAIIADHADRPVAIDVIDVQPENAGVTVLADPGSPGAIDASSKDCIVLVDCLRWAVDIPATLANMWQGLAPGGALLVAIPAAAPMTDDALGPDRWRLTPAGLEEVLMRACPAAESEIMTFGSAVSTVAFMAGLAAEDLNAAELDAHDPRFPAVVTARVRKADAR